jgi:imidazolonepropionase-like amidohydrolase
LRRPAYDRALEGVLAAAPTLLPAERAVEIARMLALAKELNLKTVLYGGHEAWRVANALKQADVPVLLSLRYPEQPRDADPTAEDPARVLEYREKARSNAGELAKAGVWFAFYSDGIAAPREILRAVKSAVDAGLSVDSAVRAMTLAPAEIFGLADRVGSIDRGKIANLTVADGDIFNANTKIKYVFVDGEKYEPRPAEPAGRGGRGPAR